MALSLDAVVPAFRLPIRLRIVRSSPHMRHFCVPDKVPKFARHKLRPIVADDARSRIGILFLARELINA